MTAARLGVIAYAVSRLYLPVGFWRADLARPMGLS